MLASVPGLSNRADLVYCERNQILNRSSAGDLVSQVITCPQCDKKLALRDELKGRKLICPQCKGRFTAPTDEGDPSSETFDSTSDNPAPADGSAMAFLDGLASAPGPAAAKTPAKTSSTVRPATAARPSAGKAASAAATASTAPVDLGASRVAAIQAKKKKDSQKMLIYIGGGVAAAVLAVIILVAAVMSFPSSGGPKGKNENIRFGLTESKRKQLFSDLFHAVDVNGVSKECQTEWRRLGGELNLNDQQISAVLQEGRDNNWEQPAFVVTTDQKQKQNRIEWIRTMTTTKREPIMGQ
jgi:hypothetical protein